MEGPTEVIGRIIRCMERESSHGLMDASMWVSMLMTRSRDMGYLTGSLRVSVRPDGRR